MPQAVDLVVANGAAVNKTFTLLSPASGFNSVAEWALKEGAISSVFPRFTASAKTTRNAKGNGKGVSLKLRIPSSYVDASSGLTMMGSAFEFNGSVTVPDDFPEALKADAAAYVKNVVATALVQAMIKDGLPAT